MRPLFPSQSGNQTLTESIISWPCAWPVTSVSLRDIVVCLKARPTRLYHWVFAVASPAPNLAYANKHRDWRLFHALAEILHAPGRSALWPHGVGAGIAPLPLPWIPPSSV